MKRAFFSAAAPLSALAVSALVVLAMPGEAAAANRTWNASSTANWNSTSSWVGSVVPTSGDAVIFNSSKNGNCTINTAVNVASITISGYTGTIAQDATDRMVNISGNFSMSSGTYSAPDVTVVGGTFTHTGGTYTHNNKTLILKAGSDVTHDFDSLTFYRVVFSDGLLAYYRGIGQTQQNDYSYFGWDLPAAGNATYYTSSTPALIADNTYAYTFDGTGDYLALGSHPTLLQPTNWTLSAWVRGTATDSSGGEIINLGNDFLIRAETDGNIRVYSRGCTPSICVSTGKDVLDGSWHHAAGTYDGSNLKVYVDGELNVTCAVTGAQTFPTGDGEDDVRIGGHTSNTTYDWNGQLDEVRVYGRALSAADIMALALGGQPAGGSYTHTISSGFTTTQDLVLTSGSLALGSGITVGGSWWNYGMAVSGTATVTFAATTTGKLLRSNGQSFYNATFNGSGAGWSFADPFDATTMSLSAGTLDLNGYLARATTISQTGGTLTTAATDHLIAKGGGTVGATSTITNLHIEDPTESDLVGYWKFDSFTGNTSPDLSGTGNTATLYNGVRASTTVPSSSSFSIANQFSIYLDGGSATAGDYASLGTTSMPGLSAAQTTCFWTNFPAHASVMHMVSLRNTTGPKGYQIGFAADGTLRVLKSSNSAVLVSTSGASLSNSTWYHICYSYDGSSTHRLYVNGSLSASSTANAPDSATPNQLLVGAYDTAQAQRYKGYIDELRIYNVKLSDTEIAALGAGRYPGRGGVATATLSSNTTVSTALQIDSGVLATSSYALSHTATGAAAEVNAGGLTINSGSGTFSGGLTVRGPGTLTMDTTGGTVSLATGKTLTMDGTLTTTTGTSTTKPTIKSVSGTYTFSVGSATTATPTLNVNGLIVKNTTANGMYINAAGTTTTTTINQFDNVDFRSGASGGSHLKIYAQQGLFHFNNLTFDSDASSMSTTYAIHLTGNGGTTTATETRVVVGNGTCKNTASACESTWERDDDSTEDGLGDTTGSDGAVIQWVYRDWATASGTIEGFPTPSFNWSTFAFWRTYLIVNNVDGGTTDRLYVRDGDGGELYYYDLPNSENWVGAPRWTTESGSHYVYAISTAGRVYKLLDNGSALSLVSGWPYQHNDSANATATSALVLDAASLYWIGNNSSSARSVFRLNYDKSGAANATVSAAVTAVPTLSISNIFYAGSGTIFRRTSSALASESTFAITNAVISGRATAYGSLLYFIENNGTLWALTQSTMLESWHYQDTSSSGHTCSNTSNCTAKNIYFDFGTSRIYYGDKDGHVYAINASTGAKITGYPLQLGSGSEEIVAAPLYKNGLIIVGSTTGKVFVINASNASSSNNPTLYRTYVVAGATTAISSVSWDGNTNASGSPVGAYMIGTADGRLIYIPAISDPG